MKIDKAWILYEPDLMPKPDANFWNYDVWQGEYARIKGFCKFDIEKIGKKFKPCLLFYEIKWTERRTHYIYELLQETPKCALKVCFEALKVLVRSTSETDKTDYSFYWSSEFLCSQGIENIILQSQQSCIPER